VRDILSQEHKEQLKDKMGLPNMWNPSDHLPVVALFKLS